jgi:hypothetical protein
VSSAAGESVGAVVLSAACFPEAVGAVSGQMRRCGAGSVRKWSGRWARRFRRGFLVLALS